MDNTLLCAVSVKEYILINKLEEMGSSPSPKKAVNYEERQVGYLRIVPYSMTKLNEAVCDDGQGIKIFLNYDGNVRMINPQILFESQKSTANVFGKQFNLKQQTFIINSSVAQIKRKMVFEFQDNKMKNIASAEFQAQKIIERARKEDKKYCMSEEKIIGYDCQGKQAIQFHFGCSYIAMKQRKICVFPRSVYFHREEEDFDLRISTKVGEQILQSKKLKYQKRCNVSEEFLQIREKHKFSVPFDCEHSIQFAFEKIEKKNKKITLVKHRIKFEEVKKHLDTNRAHLVRIYDASGLHTSFYYEIKQELQTQDLKQKPAANEIDVLYPQDHDDEGRMEEFDQNFEEMVRKTLIKEYKKIKQQQKRQERQENKK